MKKISKILQSLSYIWVFLIIPIVIREGYADIAEIKVRAAAVLCAFSVFGMVIRFFHREKMTGCYCGLDFYILMFGTFGIASFLLSRWKGEAIWAAEANYVGTVMIIGASLLYFFLSRADKNPYIWRLLYISTLIVLSVGLYQRIFRPYYDGYTFWLSSIGNVDYYYGFLAITVSIFAAIRLDYRDKVAERVLLDLLLVIGYINAWLTYANVVFLALLAGFVFVVYDALRAVNKVISVAWQGVLVGIAGVIARVAFNQNIPMMFGLESISLFALYYRIYVWIGLASFFLWCLLGVMKRKNKASDVEKILFLIHRMYFPIVGLMAVLGIAIVYGLVETDIFSNRGEIWWRIIQAYIKSDWKHKIFGWSAGCTDNALMTIGLSNRLDGLRLQTAHNEWLEYLLSLGAMGGIAFFLIFGWVIQDFVNLCKADKGVRSGNSTYAVCGIAAYLGQAFSNVSTPVNFVLLFGLLSIYRREWKPVDKNAHKRWMGAYIVVLGLLLTISGICWQREREKEREYREAFEQNEYLYLGDSRFAQMRQCCHNDHIRWIAFYGSDYELYWMMRDSIKLMPKDTVIVCEWGINQLDYMEMIKVLEDLCSLGFEDVYYMGIMPVDEEKYLTEKVINGLRGNDELRRYNLAMEEGMPAEVNYIEPFDIYIDTTEGLHYTDECYQNWFDHMMLYLGKDSLEK